MTEFLLAGHTGGLLRRASMVVQLEVNGLEARFLIVRVGYNPKQNGRRSLRTLIRQSTSRVEEALCVLPESVLFGVYRQRLSSH